MQVPSTEWAEGTHNNTIDLLYQITAKCQLFSNTCKRFLRFVRKFSSNFMKDSTLQDSLQDAKMKAGRGHMNP